MDEIIASITNANYYEEDFRQRPGWVDMSDDFHTNRDKMSSKTSARQKQALYMADETLDDETLSYISDYALLVRHGGEKRINGYYTVAGKKNGNLIFTHQRDPKAAIFREKNGTWMIVYDNELLYSNALTSDAHGGINVLDIVDKTLYPPPLRCWNAVSGNNPPPGCMYIGITDEPLARMRGDDYDQKDEGAKDGEPDFDHDLPVQMMEFTFIGNMGFALRIDGEYNKMEVIRIKEDGQAMEVGLKQHDMLLRINEEDVSSDPQQAFPMLKECVESGQPFVVTFLRRIFDNLVIMVTRAGTNEANGKYVFHSLDETDAPIFIKSDDKNWLLARLDFDDETGESIWSLQKNGTDYYIGLSNDYRPPNGGWECVTSEDVENEQDADNTGDAGDAADAAESDKKKKEVVGGQMPAPGLSYYVKTMPMMKRLIDEDVENELKDLKQHNMRMEHRNRRRNLTGKVPDDLADSDDEDSDASDLTTAEDGMDRKRKKSRRRRRKSGKDENSDDGDESYSSGSDESEADAAKVEAAQQAQKALQLESVLSQKMEEITQLQEKETMLTRDHENALEAQEGRVKKLQTELQDCNYYYWDLWMGQWQQHLERDQMRQEVQTIKTKFNLNKKELFKAKRRIDDLEDELLQKTKQVEDMNIQEHARQRTLLAGDGNGNGNGNEMGQAPLGDALFSKMLEEEAESMDKEFQLVELQTEVADLKTKLATKDIEIEELQQENEKWQDAHDSIFEQMSELNRRLSEETAVFEDSKSYYARKHSELTDNIQDNEIEINELQKRIRELEAEFKQETGREPKQWIRADGGETKVHFLNDSGSSRAEKLGKQLALTVERVQTDLEDNGSDEEMELSDNGAGASSLDPRHGPTISQASFATMTSVDKANNDIMREMQEMHMQSTVDSMEYYEDQDTSHPFESPFGKHSVDVTGMFANKQQDSETSPNAINAMLQEPDDAADAEEDEDEAKDEAKDESSDDEYVPPQGALPNRVRESESDGEMSDEPEDRVARRAPRKASIHDSINYTNNVAMVTASIQSDEHESKLKEFEKRNSVLEETIHSMQDKIDTLEEKNGELNGNMDEMENVINDNENNISKLVSMVTQVTKDMTRLETEKTRFNTEKEQFVSEKEWLRTQHSELMNENNRIQEELLKMSKEKSGLMQQVADLGKSVEQAIKSKLDLIETSCGEIDRLKIELRQYYAKYGILDGKKRVEVQQRVEPQERVESQTVVTQSTSNSFFARYGFLAGF